MRVFDLNDVGEKVLEVERGQKAVCEKLRLQGQGNDFALQGVSFEGKLFFEVEKRGFSGKIAAVDGGLACEEFESAGVLATRSVGIVFDYENGKLTGQTRFPIKEKNVVLGGFGFDSAYDFAQFSSLKRLSLEISRAIELVEKFSPDLLLLDGSLLPVPQDKPAKGGDNEEDYAQVISFLKKLFSVCLEKKCVLAGVVKDSRSKHFVKRIGSLAGGLEKEVSFTKRASGNDSWFLHFLLNQGERSCAFDFSAQDNPLLFDFGDLQAKVCGVYLKPSAFDRPLRVDFLLPKGEEKKIGNGECEFVKNLSANLSSLCRGNRAYAYPAILIEADLRAALDEGALEEALELIFSKVGRFSQSFTGLRRNARPFR